MVVANSAGVFASLRATTTASDTASTGVLKLEMTGKPAFTQDITNLAPGDAANRYVDLNNTGSIDSKDLSLSIAGTGTASLLTDGVGGGTNKALTVAVKSCSVAWTTVDGTCSGTAATEIASTTVSGYGATPLKFATTSTLTSPTGVVHLQVQVALPDQNETTVDGVLPANTVQSGSATLAYTFQEMQRVGITQKG